MCILSRATRPVAKASFDQCVLRSMMESNVSRNSSRSIRVPSARASRRRITTRMGHRCNYVLLDDGKRTLYASNWGALTIVRDFFWGLDAALRFLDGEQVVDEADGWYDDVFGEGGAAIDLDHNVVAISGGELHGHARELAIKLM